MRYTKAFVCFAMFLLYGILDIEVVDFFPPFSLSSFVGCYMELYVLWLNGGNIGWGDFVVVAMKVVAVGSLIIWNGILYNCFSQ